MSVSAKPQFHVALITAPNATVARRLARLALESRMAACVNIVPRIESHYWWQGKIERSIEMMLVIKTIRSKIKPLKKLILQNHPYDTPAFVTLPISSGSKRYLEWISESASPPDIK